MGFQVVPGANSVPVQMNDGKVEYFIGNDVYTLEVEGLRGHSFEKQCKQFVGENVLMFATNDYEVFILRYDGTGCIIYVPESAILQNFTFEYGPLPRAKHVGSGGSLVRVDGREIEPAIVELYTIGKYYLLSVDGYPASMTFDVDVEYTYRYDTCRNLTGICPLLAIDKGELCVLDGKHNEVYRLKTPINSQRGFTVLT